MRDENGGTQVPLSVNPGDDVLVFGTYTAGTQFSPYHPESAEVVELYREPDNGYDTNAIRVQGSGGRCGMIKRNIAGILAPLLDSRLLEIKVCKIPYIPSNAAYWLPLVVTLAAGPVSTPEAMGEAVENLRTKLKLQDAQVKGYATPDGWEGKSYSPRQTVKQNVQKLSKEEVAERAATALEDILSKSAHDLPEEEAPEAIRTELLRHQKQALWWMKQREMTEEMPPYFNTVEKNGCAHYVNSVTGGVQSVRPSPLCGGILADEMGLGKTLTVLSLVAKGLEERDGGSVQDCKQHSQSYGKDKGVEQHKKCWTTLILCPVSVLSNWEDQIKEHTSLNFYVFYGQDRKKRARNCINLAEYDVVLTTYNVMMSSVHSNDVLKNLKWHRVVADEAHVLKNTASKTSKAAGQLQAEKFWAVTGTPISNGLSDLYGLIKFLRVQDLENPKIFKTSILGPVKRGCNRGLQRLQSFVSALSLRRLKSGLESTMALPEKNVYLVKIDMGEKSREVYSSWECNYKVEVERQIAQNLLMRNYTCVLEGILRLRQICCDPWLVRGMQPNFRYLSASDNVSSMSKDEIRHLVGVLKSGILDDCCICLSTFNDPCITQCRHIFCKDCIAMVIKEHKSKCPMCRGNISANELIDLSYDDDDGDGYDENGKQSSEEDVWSPSEKIRAVVANIQAHQIDEDMTSCKHVVFSQFTGMLDLMEECLKQENLEYSRIDGSVSQRRRVQQISRFSKEGADAPTILLASIKAGGVGLNLTAANHAHILEPWWNLSIENQAADRLHRLGQKRTVHIHRYIMTETIEERMLDLQEAKVRLARTAFREDRQESVSQQRIHDIQTLLGLGRQ